MARSDEDEVDRKWRSDGSRRSRRTTLVVSAKLAVTLRTGLSVRSRLLWFYGCTRPSIEQCFGYNVT